jgi:hypothetical protein
MPGSSVLLDSTSSEFQLGLLNETLLCFVSCFYHNAARQISQMYVCFAVTPARLLIALQFCKCYPFVQNFC